MEYFDNYNENKYYMRLEIKNLYNIIDFGDNEEKAKENLSEKGLIFLDKIKFQGPNENS